MGFLLRDGRGWRPDSRMELAADIVLAVLIIGAFTFFTGLDAQINYIASAPEDYFLSSANTQDNSITFNQDQIELMNSASKNSLGSNTIGAERGFCGGIRNGNVRKFRLADIIQESDRTSISFACGQPFEIAVHSQPDGSSELSEEDRDMSGEAKVEVTCIQFSEISSSPLTSELYGISCFNPSNDFKEIPVYLG
jgi:hypothetical protein